MVPPAGSIYGYSEGDVRELLKELGLEQYAERLQEVDGPTLTELGAEGLKELGVDNVVHRSKLAGHVTRLTLEAKGAAEKPSAGKRAAAKPAAEKPAAAGGYASSSKAPVATSSASDATSSATNDEVLAYTAKLRRESEAKQQAAMIKALEETSAPAPRSSDMTIGEALSEIAGTMQSDSFWADLAIPLEAARGELAKEKDDSRAKAAQLIQQGINQVNELQGFFKEEANTLETVVKLLTDTRQAPITLNSPVAGVRSTRSEGHAQALSESPEEKRRKADQLRAMAYPILKSFPMGVDSDKPWTFEEANNEPMASVTIRVPPETRPSDVQVTFKASSLKVAVRGHEHQPVIDGELAGPIDVGGCAWTLEGSGEGRKLVLELEKKMGGIMWERLMLG